MEETKTPKKKNHNIIMAWFFGIAGTVLIFLGFFVPPLGDVSGSTLGGAGEFFALVGGLMGIDHQSKKNARVEVNKVRREVGLKEESEEI